MASRAYRLPTPYEQVPLQRRVSGIGLAVGINLFLLFLLIGISRRNAVDVEAPQQGITIVGIAAEKAEKPAPKQEKQTPPSQRSAPAIKPPPIRIPIQETIKPPVALDLLELTKEELHSTDKALADASTRAASGSAGEDTPVVGQGPNGETLYAAQWVREPTNRELAGYMDKRTGTGVGVVICKTLPDYRVGDCKSLGSQPVSSRVDKVLMGAAWQFKVRPPRKNGKLMVGEWVKIYLDLGPAGR